MSKSLVQAEKFVEASAQDGFSLLDQGKHDGAIVFMLYALTLAVLAVARAISNLPLHNREI